MAPATITQTAVLEKIETKCMQCQLDHEAAALISTEPDCLQKTRFYDEVRGKNEGKILSYVREWEKWAGFETPIRWVDAIAITLFHVITVIGATEVLIIRGYIPTWQTYLFTVLLGQIAGFGVTGGAHRYWSHRSYKAKWPLQIILLLCYSVAGQNDLYQWVRDHRVHHKQSETSADPHNANRGFFFAHVGWLMMKKHPHVLREGRKIDMSDIEQDPLVQFHIKYFTIFKTLFCFVLPFFIPVVFWNECWCIAFFSQALRYMLSLNFTWAVNSFAHLWGNKPYDRYFTIFKTLFCFVLPFFIPVVFWNECWCIAFFSQALRYMLSLNFTWAVNSFAHLWGNKPYDRHIMPVENWAVSVVAIGEGWHNYHHTFPWDYKAAELPYPHNTTAAVLDMFALIGWAYDLKAASPSLIEAVARNKGDPSCRKPHHH